jgi:hypothetical protein
MRSHPENAQNKFLLTEITEYAEEDTEMHGIATGNSFSNSIPFSLRRRARDEVKRNRGKKRSHGFFCATMLAGTSFNTI